MFKTKLTHKELNLCGAYAKIMPLTMEGWNYVVKKTLTEYNPNIIIHSIKFKKNGATVFYTWS